MASAQNLGAVESRQDAPLDDTSSPTFPSEEYDSNEEQQPTPTPSPSPGPAMISNNNAFEAGTSQPFASHGRSASRTFPMPAPLRRNNSSTFMAFNEMPSLPTFLSSCNLSQYLQSFNEAGAADDSMPLIIDFDEDELKSIMDHIPMKPFHTVIFRKGIRDLRERSRMGSMHFDNSQSSFMQPEPHSMLHHSYSQLFQQHSQSSQPSLSQTSHPSQSSITSPPQPSRGFTHQASSSQTSGLLRQPSTTKSSQRQSQGNSTTQHQSFVPTPSQVLSGGGIYQYVGPAPRSHNGEHYLPQATPLFSQEQSPLQRSSNKNESKQMKRRRSLSETPEPTLETSSPVLPESCSFNSNNSWSSTPNNTPSTPQNMDTATKELIMRQALIYGKHSSRSLTKYEHAINCAAQSLALEDPSLLTNKGQLWNKAKAKLLHEDYDYKRGKSRSKLPEAAQQKDQKANKERLIQKREANASNAATLRLRKIASLGEQVHRKNAEREALLAQLLHIESPEYKRTNPQSYEAEAKGAREKLVRIETERNNFTKELQSLRNKERKHQWYERRKKHRGPNEDPSDDKGDAGTDAEADEEAETDTTADPEADTKTVKSGVVPGAASVAQANPVVPKTESAAAPKRLTFKPHTTAPSSASATATADTPKAPASRSKKKKDVFRSSEYTSMVKG